MEQGEPPSTRTAAARSRAGLFRDRAPSIASPRIDLAEPLTPSLVPPLVLGGSVLAVLLGLATVAAGFAAGLWPGLLALAVVPFLVLGAVALCRVLGELALGLLQVVEDVRGIATRLPRLEATVDEVAGEIPRLGFLRLLSGGRERSG